MGQLVRPSIQEFYFSCLKLKWRMPEDGAEGLEALQLRCKVVSPTQLSPIADPLPSKAECGEFTNSWDRDWQTESLVWETSLGTSLRSQASSGKLSHPKN